MSAHFIPPEPAAIADVRRDLEALVGRASLPADPQTARSIGMGPAWVDLADAVDLASLAAGQRRHAYRMAADAVDHLIALMDALEADTEDMETVNEDGDPLDIGEADDADREPSLGAPENHPAQWHIDMADRYHTGLRHHPLGDQTNWAAGASGDAEDDGDDREPEPGYDLACDEDELDGAGEVDAELSCGWTAKVDQVHLGQPQEDNETTALERYGKGFFRSGPDDAEDGHDAERVSEDGSDDEPYGWRFQRPNAVQIAARVTEAAHHG